MNRDPPDPNPIASYGGKKDAFAEMRAAYEHAGRIRLALGLSPREARYRCMIAAINDGMNRTTAAALFGQTSYESLVREIKRFEQETGQPVPTGKRGPKSGSRNLERTRAMVAMRRDGKTLAVIGETFGLTRERVRQILDREERALGERLPRTRRRTERVSWRCALCGIERHLRPGAAARRGTLCGPCAKLDPSRAERILADRRSGMPWYRISSAEGSTNNTNAARALYCYLRRAGRNDEIRELWPRGVPHFLIVRHGAPR